MKDETKEISKIDKQLLDKIEHILGSELSSEEYDKFYNYFNEIRKPNILIDIKDVEIIKDYITNLQERKKELEQINEEHRKINGELRKTINEAIEYIEKRDFDEVTMYNGWEIDFDCKENLLKILQGKSDE